MKMKSKTKMCLFALSAALVAGCEVQVAPVGVVAAPPPVVVVAPPYYVWDGVEFVGEYNGGFMYLNGGGVWVACDPVILARFHGWERGHPDWRRGAIRYDAAHRPDPRRGPAGRRPEERREVR